MAANAHRRHDHAADQIGRRGDRLRRRLLRAGPAVAGAGGGRLSRSRRGDAKQASRPAEQRPDHGRCDAAVAGGAGPDRPAHHPAGTRRPIAFCRSGGARRRSEAICVRISRAPTQHPDSRKCRRGARRVQHPHRARRHRPARTHGGASARQCLAVAVVRDAAGGDRLQHHFGQDGRGRHQGRRPARFRNADRPQRPALDSFCTARSGAFRVGARSARGPRRAPTACHAGLS